MTHFMSNGLSHEVLESVNAATAKQRIVNITMLTDAIVSRHDVEGATRKELEELILNLALQKGCAVEFGSTFERDAVPLGYTMIEIELIPERRKPV
ncbi:MAG: hypothetical protein J0H60_07850 [Rhizobiales bacterium]|nr:hypothetical protein [Hyphomicrobiales bacterium]